MKLSGIIIGILFILSSQAQSVQDRITEIKNYSDKYYYAEGEGKDYIEASMDALNVINMQISVHVKSDFETSYNEYVEKNQGNRSTTLEEYTHSKINTYSEMTFKDAKSIEITKKNEYYKGFWFIERSNILKIFEQRKNKVFTHIKMADGYKSRLNIRDALKHYYWALALLKNHPNSMSITDSSSNPEYNRLVLTETLKHRIQYILSNLSIKATSFKTETNILVKLIIKFEGKPAKKLEYEYWYSNQWKRNYISDESGISLVRIDKDYPLDYIRVKPKYNYNESYDSDQDLKMALENLGPIYFSDMLHDVEFNKVPEQIVEPPKQTVVFASAETETYNNSATYIDATSAEEEVVNQDNLVVEKQEEISEFIKYESILNKIIDAIDSKSYGNIKNDFTTEGYKMFEELIERGDAIIYKEIDTLKLLTIGFDTEVRSIPMSFEPSNGKKSFTEDVNFTFNSDDKITSLSFSLGETAISDILSKGEGFGSEEEKYHIIRFMENYKTAYCLKRLDYIESIFDDDALIIVGNLVKKAKTTDKMEYTLNDNVEYVEMNKDDYIGSLKRVFSKNEFVNIHFEDNQVKKLEKNRILFENGKKKIIPLYDKIYGIQISQEYYSTNYADKGYLFLLFDLRDSLHPTIHIRTWQPKRDPEGKIIGLNDWNF